MAVSRVYILTEEYFEDTTILAVFATREAAEIAKRYYEGRRMNLTRGFGLRYEIDEMEVLDKATISKGEGTTTTAVGQGYDPDYLPPTQTG